MGNMRSRGLLLRVALGLAVTGGVYAAEFYVSPAGNDAWAGTKRRPYATLERARDAIRELKQQPGGLKQPVTVCLRKGTHFLKRTFTLGSEDSGTKDCPITYRARGSEDVTISGGRLITGFKPIAVNGRQMLVADVPEVRAGEW
jgi:hypothetical protein